MTRALVLAAALQLLAASVMADAIAPPPRKCPRGYRPGSDHGGPYCAPPLPRCKKGYTPRVRRTHRYCEPPLPRCKKGHRPRVAGADAYCEPPPKKPCPPGSYWTSSSRNDMYCHGGRWCETSCSKGYTCRRSSLCVRYRGGRARWEQVLGTCLLDSDCKKFARTEFDSVYCRKGSRCDPNVKRGAKAKVKKKVKVKKKKGKGSVKK